MHYILAVLVGVILLLHLLPCAFAQSNLRNRSDEQCLTIAQQNIGDAAANDRAFWDSVKDSKNPNELRAYLKQYSTGIFATLARMRLKALETGSREIRRDGRFIAYSNGTVLDTRTNLMWATKDNGSNINWSDAKSYCETYRGGGYTNWRMPTQDELAELYDARKSRPGACDRSYNVHVATELIDITCFAPWASEMHGPDAATFTFDDGKRRWSPRSDAYTRIRALPVRSGK